jgi:GTP-binding protein HflX
METNPRVPRAILVGIQVPSVDDVAHAASIEELGRLVKTLDYEVVGTMSQKRDEIGGGTVLGKGRLEELAAITGGTGVVGSMAIPQSRRPASALRTPTRRSRMPRRSSLIRTRLRSRSS